MKNRFFSQIVAIGLCVSGPIASQERESEQTSVMLERLPYEVIVTPTISRAELRELIIAVEEDFYERFNEINIDNDYDITCYKYTPTMSHITQRNCEPSFVIRARNLNASSVATGLQTELGLGTTFSSSHRQTLLDPETMRREKKPDYEILRKKLEDFTTTDLEFRSIAKALFDLKAQLANFGNYD